MTRNGKGGPSVVSSTAELSRDPSLSSSPLFATRVVLCSWSRINAKTKCRFDQISFMSNRDSRLRILTKITLMYDLISKLELAR